MSSPSLAVGPLQIKVGATLLWRVIANGNLEPDKSAVRFTAFLPNKTDSGELSLNQAARNAGAAQVLADRCDHQMKLGRPQPVGVLQIDVDDVQGAEATVWDDSMLPGRPHDHAYVDMVDLGRQERQAMAQALLKAARQSRHGGWQAQNAGAPAVP